MLTRSKMKRIAGGDKSCPQNSNQRSFVVPGHNAVEAGEMVVMNRGGTSGVMVDDDCQRTDYLQVAWLLREKLNDLVDGVDSDKGEFPELALRSLLDMAASRNIVSVDPKMLNPVLWRTLPKELLLLVFARLPLPDMTRLRCLSREWRRDMATANSEINQACDEASPAMIALLSHSSADDSFFVTIYDFTTCTWQYAYHLHLRSPWSNDSEQWPHTWTAINACDGGLVCFISLRKPSKDNGLCIVVVNLLTRVQHELPPLHCRYYTLPAIVRIKMDLDTKSYKVFVAAYTKLSAIRVEIYDSGTRQWTRARAAPPCGAILVPIHHWTSANGWCRKLLTIPGAYDSAEGTLKRYSESNPYYMLHTTRTVTDPLLVDWVLEKEDRLFVLLARTQVDAPHRRSVREGYCITEYHIENETKAWVQGKSYECPYFQEFLRSLPLVSNMCLNACDGFLMVIVHLGHRGQYFWLLDLSTSEWSKLTKTSKGMHTKGSLLFKPSWNAIP